MYLPQFKDRNRMYVINQYNQNSSLWRPPKTEYLLSNNALDTSGNGFDATVTGGSYVNDRKSAASSALQFVPSTDFFSSPFKIPQAFIGDGYSEFSYSFWVKFNALGAFQTLLTSNDNFGAIYVEQRNASLTRIVFRAWSGLGGSNFDKDYSLSFNTTNWFNIVVTAKILGTGFLSVNIYKGIYGSTPTALFASDATVNFGTGLIVMNLNSFVNGNLAFGNLLPSSSRPFNGILDDFRTWDVELTPSEITALYNE